MTSCFFFVQYACVLYTSIFVYLTKGTFYVYQKSNFSQFDFIGFNGV
ncbi:hypothetical protein MHA_1405 [Mannheimia haemolytica PHL213]|nr:hypothetical protein MHA_1405 [Mannheimia haemolytica PHL213]